MEVLLSLREYNLSENKKMENFNLYWLCIHSWISLLSASVETLFSGDSTPEGVNPNNSKARKIN